MSRTLSVTSSFNFFCLVIGIISFSADSAITATTLNQIHGTAPYLTFDNGITKVRDTNALLSITFPDNTVKTLANSGETIVVPSSVATFRDIKTLIPPGLSSTTIQSLVGPPYNYARDDDQDENLSASGTLSVSITDSRGVAVSLDDSLIPCYAPYTYKLISTDGNVTTQYGLPNSSTFSGATATFYLNSSTPVACYAKPNTQLPTQYNSALDINSFWNTYDSNQWDPNNGFKTQDPNKPEKNFPTTGFNYAFFDLALANTTASDVINSNNGGTLTSGGVTAQLTAIGSNTVRVTLLGPSYANNQAYYSSPQFTIKSGETNIYSFKLSKWYMADTNKIRTRAEAYDYCASINWRQPNLDEVTNAADDAYIDLGWNSINSVLVKRTPVRKIGGPLFAEWGVLGWVGVTNYPLSDFSAVQQSAGYMVNKTMTGYASGSARTWYVGVTMLGTFAWNFDGTREQRALCVGG